MFVCLSVCLSVCPSVCVYVLLYIHVTCYISFSGRTEKQAMQDYREKVRERRIENITFERASSERYKKRTKPFQRPDSDPVSAAVK